MEVIHNTNDIILTRWDNTNVVKNQGPNLLKLLPNWSIQGKTNNNMLYSPPLTKGIDNIESIELNILSYSFAIAHYLISYSTLIYILICYRYKLTLLC